jgi:RHS repeat-associated protein
MNNPSCSYRNLSLPEYCTGDYRFGFNGMEAEGTVYGEGNTYDFGARMYDGRIGRWWSIDPKANELPGHSAYEFALDSPIAFIDPDGEYPKLVITDEVTGYTASRVYGTPNGKRVIIVPTYKMIVYDVAKDGTETVMGTYNVTRDGWLAVDMGANGILLENHSTDPKAGSVIDEQVDLTYMKSNYYGKNDIVLTLPELWAAPYPDDYVKMGNPALDRTKNADGTEAVARGAQIHIGGYYTTKSGGNSIGGTFGCFGVCDDSQIYSTPKEAEEQLVGQGEQMLNTDLPIMFGINTSNNTMKKLSEDIKSSRDNSGPMKDKGKVIIQDRGVDYSKRKNIK